MEKTISVYDGLAIARQCFDDIGETAKVLREKFIPACREWVYTLKDVKAAHERIMAIACGQKSS